MWIEAESIPISLQAIDWESESSVLLAVLNARILAVLGNVDSDDEKLITSLSAQHPKVLERHRQLTWKLHTLEHHFDVHGRLSYLLSHLINPSIFNNREKILMLEASSRHDDGHVGKKYRQEVIRWDSRSNEEYALSLLWRDFRWAEKRPKESDFWTLSRLILSTSSHQRPPAVEKDSPLYRPYEAQTTEEKLLVFADVCGCLLSGWEYWMTESDNFYDEEWISKVRDAVWIQSRQDFLQFVWRLYTDNIQVLLDITAQDRIKKKYDINIWNLQKIKDQLNTNATSPYSS